MDSIDVYAGRGLTRAILVIKQLISTILGRVIFALYKVMDKERV